MSTAPLVALCVGHSRQINGKPEGGAVSVGNVSEHTFNTALAQRVRVLLSEAGISSFVVSKYEGSGYSSAQSWLGKHLQERGATLALELHFNSSSSPASEGHEWLHYKSSSKGKALAQSLKDSMCHNFPTRISRGVKTPDNGRGDAFLQRTPCPAVICEPFFGSNPAEWSIFSSTHIEDLAHAIAQGIADYLPLALA